MATSEMYLPSCFVDQAQLVAYLTKLFGQNGAVNTASHQEPTMETGAGLDEFIATGRTGRRNAMPDILHSQNAGVGTGGLAFDMEKLNCSDSSKSGEAPMETAPSATPGKGS